MKKNFILIFSFLMFLPILTYGSSRITRTSLDSNKEKSELVEETLELSVEDIIPSLTPSPVSSSTENSTSIITMIKNGLSRIGQMFVTIGHAIVTFGDDGEETDNTVEKVGKNIGFVGRFFNRISEFLKNICC